MQKFLAQGKQRPTKPRLGFQNVPVGILELFSPPRESGEWNVKGYGEQIKTKRGLKFSGSWSQIDVPIRASPRGVRFLRGGGLQTEQPSFQGFIPTGPLSALHQSSFPIRHPHGRREGESSH